MAKGPENCQLTSSFFFVGAQTIVGLLQTTQIISDVCLRQLRENQIRLNRDALSFFFSLFFLPGVHAPKSGKVWRKVPESDARSVLAAYAPGRSEIEGLSK